MLTAANEEFNTAPGGIIGSELISSKYWFMHIIFIGETAIKNTKSTKKKERMRGKR